MLHQLHVVLRNTLPTTCRITCTGLMDVVVKLLTFDLYMPFKFSLGCIKHTEYTCLKVNQKLWNIKSSHCGSAVTNLTSIREDTSSVPGLAQWAQILRCCACGVGWQLQLRFSPWLGSFHMPQVQT